MKYLWLKVKDKICLVLKFLFDLLALYWEVDADLKFILIDEELVFSMGK